jgi:hypothetical protein
VLNVRFPPESVAKVFFCATAQKIFEPQRCLSNMRGPCHVVPVTRAGISQRVKAGLSASSEYDYVPITFQLFGDFLNSVSTRALVVGGAYTVM